MTGELCPSCDQAKQITVIAAQSAHELERRLIAGLGGIKPYREFTFARYDITAGNRIAFTRSRSFDASKEGLYLWGPCGVGKTHLAYAAARKPLEQNYSVEILTLPKLIRKVRMKEPREEQELIDRFSTTDVLLLDDLGVGNETLYARQILQEVLDARDFSGRRGLLITSKYSLDGLANKLNDDTIPSRLAGSCSVVEVAGRDRRVLNAL